MSFNIGRAPVTRGEVINGLQSAGFSQNTDSLSVLMNLVNEFANYAFPDRTQQSVFIKLFSEIGELAEKPGDALEYADVFILLLDLAHCNGVDLASAIRTKVAVLLDRQWEKNALGVYHHREPTDGSALR